VFGVLLVHSPREGFAIGTAEGSRNQPLWWPPSKIAGRFISPYLAVSHREVEDDPEGLPVEVELPEHPAADEVPQRVS
jgi:hypothetical protein